MLCGTVLDRESDHRAASMELEDHAPSWPPDEPARVSEKRPLASDRVFRYWGRFPIREQLQFSFGHER